MLLLELWGDPKGEGREGEGCQAHRVPHFREALGAEGLSLEAEAHHLVQEEGREEEVLGEAMRSFLTNSGEQQITITRNTKLGC